MATSKRGSLAGFLVPSAIGIALFMIPVKYDGTWTIVIKIVSDAIASGIAPFLPLLCTLIVTVSAVLGIFCLKKPSFLTTYPILANTFSTTYVWVAIRVLGAVLIWLAYLGIDAGEKDTGFIHMFTCGDAGGFVLNDLMTTLVIIFFLAGLLLPLLLDFGLLEFIGAMLTRVMRPAFTIPGRAAVDCITSWIGDGTLGVMLTSNQYEQGFYSAREAAVVATTFSAVSITFSIVVLAQVELLEYFGAYYLLICLIAVACALVLPRVPPLSRKKDTFLVPGRAMPESLPEGYASLTEYALDLARTRAGSFEGVGAFLKSGLKNAAGMWFGVLPTVMAIGTVALVLANNTQIFDVLGAPFVPLLEILGVPEAVAASKTMIVGFTDMFTPAVIAAGTVADPMTKFIIAVISVTQVIYLSEVGGVILGSKIPVNLLELFVIFLERTLVSLVIAAPVAHLIF